MVFPQSTDVDLGTLGRARVIGLIGQGGEGFVYEVRRHGTSPPMALKWYRPDSATDERLQEIRTLVELGSPHPRFLWPLSLARVRGEDGFGYVMPLRESRFLELGFLLAGKDKQNHELDVSVAATITMCRQLGFSFLRLHARGLCYRDISFGNVFFDPTSGDVLICDNDNVGIDNGSGRVLGTPFFMAPEVMADTRFETMPNTDTDRHSLAVLLFYILCMGHPLEGALTESGLRDPPWLIRHFGTDPVFCLHPDRDDNRPPRTVERYWQHYPRFLRELFLQAFVTGLTDPSRRVTEGQWIKATDRLRDGMIRCGGCGVTGFWDPAEPEHACRACGEVTKPSYLLEVGRRRVAVSELATLRTDHFGVGIDAATDIGRVRAHSREADRWGLENVSGESWTALYAGGHQVTVAPQSTIDLAAGLRLRVRSDLVTVRLA